MRRALLLAFCLSGFLAPAQADELDDFTKGLADLLGGETYCGLQYDQAALAKLVESKVPADAIGWTRRLQALTMLAAGRTSEFTPSEETAHCTQLGRVARAYGLVQ